MPTKAGSSFTALTRSIHELGLMRRRYGYYWAKLIGAVVVLAAWVVAFVWIGNSWWQLVSAAVLGVLMTQIAFLGHDAAHRQIFRSGRWNDWVSLVIANLFVGISYGWWQNKHNRHHANPNKEGADPDIALGAIAMTPEKATRHRSRLMRWLVAHQGWYFFPILLLEGLSLHWDGIKRVSSRNKIERRWVEVSFLALRLGGLVALLLPRPPTGQGPGGPRRGAGRVRVLHGFLVRSRPHRHAAGLPEAQAGLPAPAGADEPQHHAADQRCRCSWAG